MCFINRTKRKSEDISQKHGCCFLWANHYGLKSSCLRILHKKLLMNVAQTIVLPTHSKGKQDETL